MFTGIVEHLGTIRSLKVEREGGRVEIAAPSLASSLAVANSVAVNGCCLTVVSLQGERFFADLSGETIRRTSFAANGHGLKVGSRVNLEQPLTAGKEFGGHFVLGHVDAAGAVVHLQPEGENWWFGVRVPAEFARYIVPKGSITIDGISLTVARWHDFRTPQSTSRVIEIAVIPYTYEHTNLGDRKPGDAVNLEGDILGKYIERYMEARGADPRAPDLSVEDLREQGF